ncbi:TRAP transporter small permease [Celeribacter sp. PS-C1]|uniref:TRAP transporter small permease n=1 Tax=Celeribacter sp. PS-C1 TaxID=2820813 RepID=UPI001C68321F|nr:TRAP transporter small permease [Celeribacter sp. PS-C1]MBW6417594.1 TRAP transporter small permease [Celeribacter sp. PS-C1]
MPQLTFKTLISHGFLAGAGACFLFGTGVTVGDVALRAIVNKNIPGAIEMTSLSIGLGALLSMPVCYAKRTHVTAKLLSELSPNRFTYPLGLVGALASAVFAAILVWIVAENAIEKLGSPETTADLGLPIPVLITIVALALAASLVAALAGLRFALRNERDWG